VRTGNRDQSLTFLFNTSRGHPRQSFKVSFSRQAIAIDEFLRQQHRRRRSRKRVGTIEEVERAVAMRREAPAGAVSKELQYDERGKAMARRSFVCGKSAFQGLEGARRLVSASGLLPTHRENKCGGQARGASRHLGAAVFPLARGF
jgi:hypothetical protein